MTRQCLKIRQIAGRARPFIASQAPRGTCSQSYPQKVGIGNFHAKVLFFLTRMNRPCLTISGGLRVNSYKANKDNELKILVYLTDMRTRPIVFLWEELTPRGNMVHQGIER